MFKESYILLLVKGGVGGEEMFVFRKIYTFKEQQYFESETECFSACGILEHF